MPQRKLRVLALAPRFSPAFRIPEAFYDRPGAASLVLDANLKRLERLDECQKTVIRLLRDPLSRMVLDINTSLNTTPLSARDALLHHAFGLAIKEVFARNRGRIEQALQMVPGEPPAPHERQYAANLYAAPLDATWPQISVARETYHATEWLLGYAASADAGNGIAISQALIEASSGLAPVSESALAQPYQDWAAAVLANLPDADSCID